MQRSSESLLAYTEYGGRYAAGIVRRDEKLAQIKTPNALRSGLLSAAVDVIYDARRREADSVAQQAIEGALGDDDSARTLVLS